jgi:Ankyrin repeats (many copies)
VSDESEAGSLSEDQIVVPSSTKRSRAMAITSDVSEDEQKFPDPQADKRKRKSEARARQREHERELNRQIVDSLRKKKRSDFDLISEGSFVADDSLSEDSMIVSDDELATVDAEDDEEGAQLSWVETLKAAPQLSILGWGVTEADERFDEDKFLGFRVVNMRDYSCQGELERSVVHSLAVVDTPAVFFSRPELLIIQDVYGITPLLLLVLNPAFDNVSDLKVVKIDEACGIDFVQALVLSWESRPIARTEAWLIYFKACKLDKPTNRALLLASERCDSAEVIDMLLSLGGDLTLTKFIEDEEHTLMHRAASAGLPKTLEALASALADRARENLEESISIRHISQALPLHLACAGSSQGHFACVQFLVELGVAYCPVDDSGWPPLLYALYSGSAETVKYMLDWDISHGAPQFLRVIQLASQP